MVRFGDGELGQILRKGSIDFQKYDENLANRLHEILTSKYEPNILVCIPDLFRSVSKLKAAPRQYWMEWIVQNRAKLSKLLPKHEYGDSLVSRLYLPWIDKSDEMVIVNNLKKTWENKNVMIVEGTKTRWGVGNDLLDDAKTVRRILCPAENAFSVYDRIYSACMKYSENVDIFLLALGPTATVLAFDLANSGVRALDLGHFDLQYEYLLQKSSERVQIVGKYNNEIADTNIATCENEDYLKSIAEKIQNE